MRKALRYAAASLDDDSTTGSVTFADGRQFTFTDADRAALKTLATELRARAAGHKGKAIK